MVQMNVTVPPAPERSSPVILSAPPVILSAAKDLPAAFLPLAVILSAAKDLPAGRDRPFAEFTLERSEGLRVTRCDCSNGQEHFVQIEPCLTIEKKTYAQ